MTPNGAVVFAIIMMIAVIAAGAYGITILYATLVLFAAIEVGRPALTAVWRATLLMAPLAAFMLIVWVGMVGRGPHEIAAGVAGSRASAFAYVAMIVARLFLIVCLLQLVVFRFASGTPMSFVRALHAPAAAKRLIVLTLSQIETLRYSIDRAHTALVAAGIITRRLSVKNLANGWILAQTVWLTAITTVTARIRDKWPIEQTIALVDPALAGGNRRLSTTDTAWLAAALAAGLSSQAAGFYFHAS
jgi:hypothetical protein